MALELGLALRETLDATHQFLDAEGARFGFEAAFCAETHEYQHQWAIYNHVTGSSSEDGSDEENFILTGVDKMAFHCNEIGNSNINDTLQPLKG